MRKFFGILLLLTLNALSVLRAETFEVFMLNVSFDPSELTINVGDTVIWEDISRPQHDTVAYNGLWESPLLSQGDSFQFTFTQPGRYDYRCRPHEEFGMIGV